jgi:hypothetical protein
MNGELNTPASRFWTEDKKKAVKRSSIQKFWPADWKSAANFFFGHTRKFKR